MCVQPMKSIAAVALTDVAGLQVGVGLRLASKGIRDISQLSWVGSYDCIGMAIGCALLSMFWLRDNENGMKKKEDVRESCSQPIFNGDGDDLAGTVTNTITPSLDGDNADDNNIMELGSLNSTHQLETANEVQPERSSKPHNFSRILKRACCCLDPLPKTPHPVGIYLFLIGCIFAAITIAKSGETLEFFGAPVVINAMKDVTAINWRQGFLQGALPQLPLTTLNSVISVCCLAHSLFPEKRDPTLLMQKGHQTDAVVTRREVSISVGLMNLILCPLGSMPNCHGAGGLAGQHRFGARTGTSVVVLGLGKIFLAVFFGASALTLLDAVPVAVLSTMLVIAGFELVGTGVGMLFECIQKEKDRISAKIEESGNADQVGVNTKAILRKNALVSMVTAGVIVALQKTHYGAISGWVVHCIYGDGCNQLINWIKRKRRHSNEE